GNAHDRAPRARSAHHGGGAGHRRAPGVVPRSHDPGRPAVAGSARRLAQAPAGAGDRGARPGPPAQVERPRDRPLPRVLGLHRPVPDDHRGVRPPVHRDLRHPAHRSQPRPRLPRGLLRRRRGTGPDRLRGHPQAQRTQAAEARLALLRLAHAGGLGRARAHRARHRDAVRHPCRAARPRHVAVAGERVGAVLQQAPEPGDRAARGDVRSAVGGRHDPRPHRRHHGLPRAGRALQAPAHRHRADQRADQAQSRGHRARRSAAHDEQGQGPRARGGRPRGRHLRRRQGRGLQMDRHARHGHVHRVRTLPVAVPGLEHRQAAVAEAADHEPARPPVRQGAVHPRLADRAGGPRPRLPRRRHASRSRRPRGRLRPGQGHQPRPGRPPARRDRRGGRGHRPRRPVELHDVRRLRRAVPGRHRARRPHPRHAPLPGADRERVPQRGRRDAAQPRERRQPLGSEQQGPQRLDGGAALPGARRRRRDPRRGGVPVLGRLRRRPGGPQQEGHPRRRRAAAHRRRRVRRARLGRDLLRRPGPAPGQRVRLPDAGGRERRDAEQRRCDARERRQDRRDVPALLQHPRQRVPAARRALRGRPPHPAARVTARRRAPRPGQPGRREGHLPRPVLPRPAQQGLHASARDPRRHQRSEQLGDAALQGARLLLRRRRRPHVDGGEDRQVHQRGAHRRGARAGPRHRVDRLPVLHGHAVGRRHRQAAVRRGQGRRAGARRVADPRPLPGRSPAGPRRRRCGRLRDRQQPDRGRARDHAGRHGRGPQAGGCDARRDGADRPGHARPGRPEQRSAGDQRPGQLRRDPADAVGHLCAGRTAAVRLGPRPDPRGPRSHPRAGAGAQHRQPGRRTGRRDGGAGAGQPPPPRPAAV
ncbi:MAG: Fe-S oxidoreductase, partial [uncultured Frankineae bacterium]